MAANRNRKWGKLLGDVPTAGAILDRFLHHAQTIAITGRSYRLKDHATIAGKEVFILFSGNRGVVFKPIAPPGNGNRLGMVQETIQDRAGRRHVAQKFAPFPVAVGRHRASELTLQLLDYFTSSKCRTLPTHAPKRSG